MRISKRCREQAAHILAAAASSETYITCMIVAKYELGYTNAALKLAESAFDFVEDQTYCELDFIHVYAEAEALLRTGWSPK